MDKNIISIVDDITIDTGIIIPDSDNCNKALSLRIQKIILVFGKTGAGKSSLLNSLTNKSLNLFREGENNLNSDTSEINSYVYKLFSTENNYSCLFIDTPGLFDSKDRDRENILKISRFLQKSGYSIILFTHSILETKIDQTFNYTLDLLIEIFGENVMHRVYFVLTQLNQLNVNIINSKKEFFKENFNKSVNRNVNELLFYDYDNKDNNNFGMNILQEKLKTLNSLLYPITKEEKLTKDLISTKLKSLEVHKQNLLSEFQIKNDKFTLSKTNKETQYSLKQNQLQSEVSKKETETLNNNNNYVINKQQEYNSFVSQKQQEFNTFKTNSLMKISQKQTDFYSYGGSINNNNYTISGNNAQTLFEIYNSIGNIEQEIKSRAESTNLDIQNKGISINNEVTVYKANQQKSLEDFCNQKNSMLESYKKQLESEMETELINLRSEQDKTNSKLKEIQKEVINLNGQLNYLSQKKYNINYILRFHTQNNLWKIVDIENNDMFEYTDFEFFNKHIISKYTNHSQVVFDREFSQEFYMFESNLKTATFKKGSNNMIYEDYHLYPVTRINCLFKKSFLLSFKINSYGWYGIGSKEVVADGFPGYTENGYVINTEGKVMHNKKVLRYLGVDCLDKKVYLEYDSESKTIKIFSENKKNSVKLPNLPSEFYFIFSVPEKTSIDIYNLSFP